MRTSILCPACGADRVIPLTFPQDRPEADPDVAFRRPMGKCCACGERLFGHLIATSRVLLANRGRSGWDQSTPGDQDAATI
jgi:hypothetical protein